MKGEKKKIETIISLIADIGLNMEMEEAGWITKVLSEILKEIQEKKKNDNNTSINQYLKNILNQENINIQDIQDIPNFNEILNNDNKIEKD